MQMVIAALDDEPLQLSLMTRSIREACPNADILSFASASSFLASLEEGVSPDVAFVDIEMPDMTGIQLAKCLKSKSNKTNIVFVTGHSAYAIEAAMLHSSGYVLKPVTTQRIKDELANLRYPQKTAEIKPLVVHTFGNFEVFANTVPVNFRSAKAKELFALLIDRRGAGLSTAEIAAVLWEEREYSVSIKNQVQKIISQLRTVLSEYNYEQVLIKSYNSTAVDMAQVSCDYYDFISNDAFDDAVFAGEYMAQYSWAEDTAGFLYHSLESKRTNV